MTIIIWYLSIDAHVHTYYLYKYERTNNFFSWIYSPQCIILKNFYIYFFSSLFILLFFPSSLHILWWLKYRDTFSIHTCHACVCLCVLLCSLLCLISHVIKESRRTNERESEQASPLIKERKKEEEISLEK